MSRKKYFERNLHRTNIREQDWQEMIMIRTQSDEPFYSIVQRVWGAYKMSKAELEEELTIAREHIEVWKKRALECEKSNVNLGVLGKNGNQRLTSYQ